MTLEITQNIFDKIFTFKSKYRINFDGILKIRHSVESKDLGSNN